MTNPVIPETLADRFCLGAVAYNAGQRQMVAAMREYAEECGHARGFSVMQMYEDFAALTEQSTGEPTITARTARYYYENTADLSDKLFAKFMEGAFTFEHCQVDKTLTGERGIQRGQAIEWAIQYADKGRKVASVRKMWLHFAEENGKEYGAILLSQWQRKVGALAGMKLPPDAPKQWLHDVSYHVTELQELIGKGFANVEAV